MNKQREVYVERERYQFKEVSVQNNVDIDPAVIIFSGFQYFCYQGGILFVKFSMKNNQGKYSKNVIKV